MDLTSLSTSDVAIWDVQDHFQLPCQRVQAETVTACGWIRTDAGCQCFEINRLNHLDNTLRVRCILCNCSLYI